jgi:hypothetical protein
MPGAESPAFMLASREDRPIPALAAENLDRNRWDPFPGLSLAPPVVAL